MPAAYMRGILHNEREGCVKGSTVSHIIRPLCGGVMCLFALLLAACASGGAPVLDLYSIYNHHKPPVAPVTQGSYSVKGGDTLYSIAYRYGWSLSDLADANHIRPPYTIYPGETIHFDRRVPMRNAVSRGSSHAVASSPQATSRPPRAKHQNLPKGAPHWRWPSRGKLLSNYGTLASPKGIDIGGEKGSPVLAAAAGVVVYRGTEVAGYGNLLIIKHNDHWLSAYAHNNSLLVKEGESVKAGQKIATLGSTGTWRTQLYFEIRRDGKPVNPTHLLPQR